MLYCIPVLCFALAAVAQDISGSKDHPLITRYPGSRITYYDVQQYDDYILPLGALTLDDKVYAKKQELGGKITRIHYELKGTVSATEVFKNYTDALAAAEFETLVLGKAEKGSNDVAGANWTTKTYKSLPNVISGTLGNFGHTNRRRFIAAKHAGATGDVYVALMVTQKGDDEVHAQLDVIEVEPVKTGLVNVDAAYLKSEIERTGRVALYGIYFDVDKSDVKSESQPVLQGISELLKQNPSWNLYVVGHTDMTGELEHNMKLSDDRAKSVVNVLVKDYGITAARLSGYGVGPLSPVATNDNDGGRAKNRRVELVKK